MSSFSVTGIYPYNPEKVLSKINPKEQRAFTPQSLAERTGLANIPLYSPAPSNIDFDNDDMDCSLDTLDRSLSNCIDLTPMRYRATSVSRFLITPKKLKSKNTVSCGKVLTSIENLKEIEEKERSKAQALKDKEDRKAKREAIKVEKALKGIKHADALYDHLVYNSSTLCLCVFYSIIMYTCSNYFLPS